MATLVSCVMAVDIASADRGRYGSRGHLASPEGHHPWESIVSLEACLPADLNGPSTKISRIAAGLSGAGVYRVEAEGQVFVLKISSEAEPLATWRRRRQIQRLAAQAGLAPRVIHTDEARRAVLSAFVADRSFPALLGNPSTREAALALLGRALRRVHELPLPADIDSMQPRDFLAATWSGLVGSFALPAFVVDAVERVLAEQPSTHGRAPVLSHNDVNPTNLVYDGETLLLLDWDTAGQNDPFFDLGAISVFLRMDEGACRALLTAYDGAPVSSLPQSFGHCQRLAAALCGAICLNLARQGGHAGATGAETLDSTPALADFYQRLRSGALSIASAEGQWWFGLALLKASAGF